MYIHRDERNNRNSNDCHGDLSIDFFIPEMLSNLLVGLLATSASAQTHEPPNGKVYLAAWLDTADSAPGKGDGDRPRLINQRLGFNLSSFQYSQFLPVVDYPFPIEQIEELGTDALVYLTIDPRPNPWSISDAAIAQLAAQCEKMTKDGKRVLLRLGPGIHPKN